MATTVELTALRDAALTSPAIAACEAAEAVKLVEFKAAQATLVAGHAHEVYAAYCRAESAYKAAQASTYEAGAVARGYQVRINKLAEKARDRHDY